MINENEVAMLLICFGVFIFIFSKRREYKRIPYWLFIIIAFYIFFAAVIFTVAEGFISTVLLNILEHLCYMFSSLAILLWCWLTFRRSKGGG